jgi:hypothetical protein
MKECALWAFVKMHDESLLREGASDPTSSRIAIRTARASRVWHGIPIKTYCRLPNYPDQEGTLFAPKIKCFLSMIERSDANFIVGSVDGNANETNFSNARHPSQ